MTVNVGQALSPANFWWLLALLASLAGCGSVGEPLYPALKIPTRVIDLTAVERGDKIDIRFTIPPLTTDGFVLKEIGKIELRIGANQQPGFNPNDWATGAQQIDIEPPKLPGAVHAVRPAQDLVGKELMVGVRVANARGRMSEWSNFFPITIEAPLAKPEAVKAEPAPEGVRVGWNAPNENAFRIFRKAGDQEKPALLGTSDKPEYLDAAIEYGKTYQYYVQAIHDKTESDVVESNSIAPKDVFPPRVPTGLTASPGVGAVELAWTRNTEPDFKEYRVFRSEENAAFVQIADGLVGPAYSDRQVQPGKHYRYRVSALDQAGNQSDPSEPVEVSMP